MTASGPSICRVLYDRDPSPRRHDDDDPFIPYRFSFLKSYSSSDSQEQFKSRHARRHGNITQASGLHDNENRVTKSSQPTQEAVTKVLDINLFHLTQSFLEEEIKPAQDLDQNASSEKQLIQLKKKRKRNKKLERRLIWDPINNTWISPDPADIDFIHFVNAMSLIDRGIYSTRNVLERKHRLFPCMEKHARTMHFGKTRGKYERFILGIGTTKNETEISLPSLTSPMKSKGSPAFNSNHSLKEKVLRKSRLSDLIPRDHSVPVEDKGQADDGSDSSGGRSNGKTSHPGSGSEVTLKNLTTDNYNLIEIEQGENLKDLDLPSTDEERTIVDPEDFIRIDRKSFASDGGSDKRSSSTSESARQRKVQIGDAMLMSFESQDDRKIIRQETQKKTRQIQDEVRFGFKSDVFHNLPPLRNLSKIRVDCDSDNDDDNNDAGKQPQQQQDYQKSEADDSTSEVSHSCTGDSMRHRPSLPQLTPPESELESEIGRRNLAKKRLSWLQRLRRRARKRRGGAGQENGDHSSEENSQKDLDLRFEDYDWLAQYCIIDPNTVALYKQIFDEVDENRTGKLDCIQTMVALRASNYKLTDMLEEYMYKIIELTGYDIENGSDYKLFAVLSSLSVKITALEDWMKCLIDKTDLKTLEEKLFLCKVLWECSVDPDSKTISLDDLCVELRAGGVSLEHELNVRQKLEHLRHLDLLDFLTYVPLFIMIHESVVENPLEDRRDR